eukprot:TRINITY_DN8062_c0_g2_i1.p1 TRINITY_DN8062_c0_g2~~TRINITY_DN8062_c0_g2_i1.p1  ORF type:complete len:647 (+),score=170.96 TRINITY_DN8062_c0_g2_i1:99-2039(+)
MAVGAAAAAAVALAALLPAATQASRNSRQLSLEGLLSTSRDVLCRAFSPSSLPAYETTEETRSKAFWIQVIVLAVMVVVVVIVCCAMCGWPWQQRSQEDPAANSENSGDVEDAAASVDENESLVKAQLRRLKRERMQLLVQQATGKRKLEQTLEAIRELCIALEEEEREAGAEDPEKVHQEIEESVKGAEVMLNQGVLSAFAQAAPFVMQGKVLADTMEARIMTVQKKASEALAAEVREISSDVLGAMSIGDEAVRELRTLADTELPTVSVLIASVFAPAQLRLSASWKRGSLLYRGILTITSLAVILKDFYDKCAVHPPYVTILGHDMGMLHFWFAVDAWIGGIVCLVYAYWLRTIDNVLMELDQPPRYEAADSPIQALRKLVEYYLSNGNKALLYYDRIAHSRTRWVVDGLLFTHFFMMSWGMLISFNTSWESNCNKFRVAVLRMRIILFLVLFLPDLMSLGSMVGMILSNTTTYYKSCLRSAKAIDDALALGFPFAGLITRAFLVRDSTDMVSLELRVQRSELDEIRLERLEREKELEAALRREERAKKNMEDILARRKDDSHNEEAYNDEQKEARRKIFDAAENLFHDANARARSAMTDFDSAVAGATSGVVDRSSSMSAGAGGAVAAGSAPKRRSARGDGT